MAAADSYAFAVQVHRMLRSGERVNCSTIARRFDISSRSALRVVDFLRDTLGAPIEYDNRKRVYFYSDTAFDLTSALMTEGEAVAMLVAHEMLLRRQFTPLGAHLRKALQTLTRFLPSRVTVGAGELLERVTQVPDPARPVASTIMDAVVQALEQKRRLDIEYWPPGGNGETSRAIDVYHLAQARSDWYAVAWCHLRHGLRTFALSRIKSAVLTSARYEIPRDFDAKSHFQSALGIEIAGEAQTISLRFDADQARWVRERTWHPTQVLEPQPDGSLLLTLQVGISTELKQWILGYGPHVEVLAPPALRTAIAAALRQAAAQYPSAL